MTQPDAAERNGVLIDLAPRLFNVPLLMEWERFGAIRAALMTSEGIDPGALLFFFADDDDSGPTIRDGIAIIEVKRALFDFRLKRIRKQVERALADDQVRGILLDVDSPGGQVMGTFDLSDFLFEARAQKPLWAIANDDAFSAAYALASATERVSVTRTGGVGSVGVIAVHVEFSEMDKAMGVKFTPAFFGARKYDFADTEPLSDEAFKLLMAEINRLGELFVANVARNRDLKPDVVRATEAGLFFGPNGVEAGFADAVETFDVTFEAFRASLAAGGTRRPAAQPAAKEDGMADPKNPKPDPNGSSDPKDKAPAVAPGPASTADVIDLDAARAEGEKEGREAQRAQALAIEQLCQLVGCPERAGAFMAEGLNETQVREKLTKERAESAGPELDGHARPNVDTREPKIDIDAVYQRWNTSANRAASHKEG